MKRKLLAAGAAALLLASAGARADAYVDGTFAGMAFNSNYSAGSFNYFLFGQQIAGNSSYSQTFTYSITLHNDGLPGAPVPTPLCTPFHDSVCTPAYTGNEYAVFDFGLIGNQYQSGQYQYAITGLPMIGTFSAAPGQTVTYSGQFTVTESTASSLPAGFRQTDQDVLYAATFIDTTGVPAVPEPTPILMMLAGVSFLAWRKRRA